MNAEGLNKAALLLMSIGEEEAAEVFKYLAPREVQKIGATMASLKNVTREQLDNVMTEFVHEAEQHTALSLDSSEYIRSVLTKALGETKAGALIDRILQGSDTSGIEGLKWMDSARRRGADQERASADHRDDPGSPRPRPGIGNRRAALRPAEKRRAVAHRDARRHPAGGIARTRRRAHHAPFRQRQPEARADGRHPHGGGNPQLHVEQRRKNRCSETVKEYDAELAQKIIDQMFVFENLLDLEDRAIQLLLKEVESETLIVSLKGAQPALRQKFLANMSQRAAELLAEDLDSRGPVRVSEVEQQQRKILQIVRNLAENGQIQLGGKAEDAYV